MVPIVERLFAERLARDFVPAKATDFRSADGRCLIEIKTGLHGVRDLYATILSLALLVGEDTAAREAVLIAHLPRLSAARVEHEWRRLADTLHPRVVGALHIVAVTVDGCVVLPHAAPWLTRMADIAQEVFAASGRSTEHEFPGFTWTTKGLAVWCVLVDAWVQHEALSIGEIERRSGCSYPTARMVVEYLEVKGEIEHGRYKSKSLRGLPRRSLDEILAATDKLRGTRRFVDATGRPAEPQGLIRSILAKQPSGVAIGGVAAARFYMPEFDLNGLPRVDLIVQEDAVAFVKDLDPALEAVGPGTASPLLVVHRSQRDLGLAADKPPYAPPADVLLDLLELRLVEQAVEFLQALRGHEGRHG